MQQEQFVADWSKGQWTPPLTAPHPFTSLSPSLPSILLVASVCIPLFPCLPFYLTHSKSAVTCNQSSNTPSVLLPSPAPPL